MNQRHLPPQQQDVLSIPATDLAAFDARSLFQLMTLAADRLATAKAEVDHIEHALNLKYGERAKHLRLVAGKVIQATEAGELLPRVASEPSFYECKYCAWARRCWREQGVSASGVQS